MINKYKILIIAFFLIAASGISIAQDDFREKIEDVKLEKLTKKLELEGTNKTDFIDKYKAFSKSMRSMNLKRAKTFKLMTQNIESGNGLDTLVDKLIEYENQINQAREDFVAEMKAMLTSQQLAKMIVFERRFNSEIKKLLKDYQKNNKKERPFKDD